MCLQTGEITVADVVDHRIPISKRGRKERSALEAYPALDRLASLCQSHFGNPNDRNHPWYRKGAAKTKG